MDSLKAIAPPSHLVRFFSHGSSCVFEEIRTARTPASQFFDPRKPSSVSTQESDELLEKSLDVLKALMDKPEQRQFLKYGGSCLPVWTPLQQAILLVTTIGPLPLQFVNGLITQLGCAVVIQKGFIGTSASDEDEETGADVPDAVRQFDEHDQTFKPRYRQPMVPLSHGASVGHFEGKRTGSLGGFIGDAQATKYGETCGHVLKETTVHVGHPGGRDTDELLEYAEAQLTRRQVALRKATHELEEAQLVGARTKKYELQAATRQRLFEESRERVELLRAAPRGVGVCVARFHGICQLKDESALAPKNTTKEAIIEKMSFEQSSLHASEVVAKMVDYKVERCGLTVDTALFLITEDDILAEIDLEEVSVSFREIAPPKKGMVVEKLGKTTKHSSGEIVGRRYVVMPATNTITFEYVVISSLVGAGQEFSAKGDSGGWVWERKTDKVVAKIMGEFRGECWLKCSVVSSMPLCMQKLNEVFDGPGPLRLYIDE
ncbi:hypothetical protein BJ508DRAFT_363935 [Ascobolus immersus RN42]|uniref:Uncharacterized protein n=1 Tax=Ascobolus immersus RN42 TaxID=1160509 RepID=A0A3N4HWL4_ASCIM|nr:hypothetical protein BJ508DRAFT_363935 [Ascobolus immersus RN42]